MQYSQEHLKTMVYAKFGGQPECIMGNSKIENSSLWKTWDNLGPKLSARAFVGLFGGTSRAAILNYDETRNLLCAFVHK